MTSAPVHFSQGDDAEEVSRADIYGLLAQLWAAPPSGELLAQLQGAPVQPAETDALLAAPWRALLEAMRSTSVQAATDEYDALVPGRRQAGDLSVRIVLSQRIPQ